MVVFLYSVMYPPLLKEKKIWVQVLSHRVFSFLEVVCTQCICKVPGWIRVVSLFSLPLISKLLVGSFSERERWEREIDTFCPIFVSMTLTLSHFLSLTQTHASLVMIADIIEFHLFIYYVHDLKRGAQLWESEKIVYTKNIPTRSFPNQVIIRHTKTRSLTPEKRCTGPHTLRHYQQREKRQKILPHFVMVRRGSICWRLYCNLR
jgi:hypothetical protein